MKRVRFIWRTIIWKIRYYFINKEADKLIAELDKELPIEIDK